MEYGQIYKNPSNDKVFYTISAAGLILVSVAGDKDWRKSKINDVELFPVDFAKSQVKSGNWVKIN